VYLIADQRRAALQAGAAAVPQGEPVATQSKLSPILDERFETCQLPE
jgi:hypothetical protein